ncbi:MAG: hypothetical protein KF823_08585 [Xanthomonadales bacterium]|nr:hypothetical protein [Xanthomonadales bacterium]
MSPVAGRALALVPLVLGLLAGCATGGGRQSAHPAPASGPVASAVDPGGRMSGYQFARRYSDVVKLDGRDVRQDVEYGFDYDRRSTVRRVFDPDGRLLSEDLLPGESLRANAAEEARLEALVRGHPELGPLMAGRDDLLVHRGGFVVREAGDPWCDLGSRCLRFIVSAGDGSIPVLHAVVDLVSDRVVYTHDDHQVPADPP